MYKTIPIIVVAIVVIMILIVAIHQTQEYRINTAIKLAETITVLRPSFMTLKNVQSVLKGTGFQGYETAFLRAEEESGIGADWLIAIALHETGNGSNKWWKEWNNAFSWGITDSGPNSEAYKIKDMTKEQAIVYTANQIKKYYLTPTGSYYAGETLSAMNTYYASDKQWALKVINIHNTIVKKLPEIVQAKQWIMETKILKGDLPGPQYYTDDYWTRSLTREDIAIILWRINNK